MKKILSLLLVLVTMLALCTSLVACGGPKPQLNLDKAEDCLKDHDYFVVVEDGEEYGGYEGYAVEEYLYAEDDNDNELTIIKFKTSKAAKLYYKYLGKGEEKTLKYLLKKYGNDMDKDEKKYLEKELKEAQEWVIGRSGKYVWYGTKDAIKDSKK